MKTTKQMTMQEYADFRGGSRSRVNEIIRKVEEWQFKSPVRYTIAKVSLLTTGCGPKVESVEISTVGKTRVLTVTYFEL